MRRVHFGEALPDFGDAPAMACRKSGYVLGTAKGNPLQFDSTFDSAQVTCKACIKLLAKRTAAALRVMRAEKVVVTINGVPMEDLGEGHYLHKTQA